jgi:hypothetical protein
MGTCWSLLIFNVYSKVMESHHSQEFQGVQSIGHCHLVESKIRMGPQA